MSGCDRILERLKAGPATAAELYALGVMVHSRVADLRKRGHVITCEHIAGKTGTAGFEYRLLDQGGNARLGAAAPALIEQPVLHSPPPAAPIVPASEWTGNPAPAVVGGASDGTHLSDGAEAGQDSGDTAAGRVAWHGAGNGSPRPASPEQLSIEDALAAA